MWDFFPKICQSVIELEKIQLLDTRTILAMIVIIGAVTGGNLWIHRGDPLLGYTSYNGHGFSIDYRHDMRFEELGLGRGSATESIGMVEGRLEGKGLEQFGVIWMTRFFGKKFLTESRLIRALNQMICARSGLILPTVSSITRPITMTRPAIRP